MHPFEFDFDNRRDSLCCDEKDSKELKRGVEQEPSGDLEDSGELDKLIDDTKGTTIEK